MAMPTNPFNNFLSNVGSNIADINWLNKTSMGQIGTDSVGNPIMGQIQEQGALLPGLQALGSGMNAWLGMQQLDLAKDQLAFQKDTFAKNYANQANLTNQELLRRQALRQQTAGQAGTVSDEWKMNNLLPTK